MSKADEAFDQAAQRAKLVGPERGIAYVFFEAGRAYQKERDLAAVEAVKQTRKFSATPYIRCESLCDEIARRIKTPLTSER